MSPAKIVLLILLILLLVGGLPNLGLHSYGWAPSSGLGLILLIVVLLIIFGVL